MIKVENGIVQNRVIYYDLFENFLATFILNLLKINYCIVQCSFTIEIRDKKLIIKTDDETFKKIKQIERFIYDAINSITFDKIERS